MKSKFFLNLLNLFFWTTSIHAAQTFPKVCIKLAKQTRPMAEQCLQMSDREKRAKCFASIGVLINKEAPKDICEPSLEPIKQEFVLKEKKLFPNQDPALK